MKLLKNIIFYNKTISLLFSYSLIILFLLTLFQIIFFSFFTQLNFSSDKVFEAFFLNFRYNLRISLILWIPILMFLACQKIGWKLICLDKKIGFRLFERLMKVIFFYQNPSYFHYLLCHFNNILFFCFWALCLFRQAYRLFIF